MEGESYTQASRRAGRALATLFLPTVEGVWEPARQLTRNRVDEARLGTLPEELDLDKFLGFLGVTPAPPEDAPPLTFVEGGPEGLVEPRESPPAITTAGRGGKNPGLGRLPGEDKDEDPAEPEAWRRSIRAAWNDWLKELIEAERDLRAAEDRRARTDLIEPLGAQPWYPAGHDEAAASPPTVSTDESTRVAPRQLTLLSRQHRQFPTLLWSVDSHSPDAELLEALGATGALDRETLGADDAEPAFRLLAQLRSLSLQVIEDHPTARQALVQLFQRILSAIVRHHESRRGSEGVPLLTFRPVHQSSALSERQLEWRDRTDDEAWIARDHAGRERLRRFFPDSPLVAATVGPQVLDGYPPLEDRGVGIDAHVRPEQPDHDESELVARLDERLQPSVISKLLALGEAAHQVKIDPVDAADRWRNRSFRHVEDAWVEFHARHGDVETRTQSWLKDSYDDVLYLGDDPPTILFDTPPDAVDRLPPLAEFGEPLAELLLGEGKRGVGSLFARALGELDAGGVDRLDRFVKKEGAAPLVTAYERHFKQLGDEARADLLEKTERALAELGLRLRERSRGLTGIRSLSPEDLEGVRRESSLRQSELRQSDLNAALAELDLSEAQTPFRPKFACDERNRRIWRDWFDQWRERLVAYLLDLHHGAGVEDIDGETLLRRLQGYLTERELPRLAFDPTEAVVRWLEQQPIPEDAVPPPDELLERVRRFSPLYEPVDSFDDPAGDAGWNRHSLQRPSPNDSERGTVDPGAVARRMAARSVVGREAERAAVQAVARATAELLEQSRATGDIERAWEVLFWAIPEGGVTAEHLDRARIRWNETEQIDDLAEGLHVSSVWDGAGWDLLGLDRTEAGKLQPVRYEVKGLPAEGSVVKLYLTRNELAVFRRIRLEPDAPDEPRYRGDWRLVGVEPDGHAAELTRQLEGLPGLVQPLRDEGFDHDGLVVYIERDS